MFRHEHFQHGRLGQFVFGQFRSVVLRINGGRLLALFYQLLNNFQHGAVADFVRSVGRFGQQDLRLHGPQACQTHFLLSEHRRFDSVVNLFFQTHIGIF